MFYTLNNGVQMPMIGFGTVGLTGSTGTETILNAIETGYRMIDTAHMYGNEREVGQAIHQSGLKREDLFITTKINETYNSYAKSKSGIEQSFEALGIDYIDLYLIHEPYEESLEMYDALKEAYTAGRIRAIGISNFNRRRYDNFIQACGIIPAINQIESHVFYPQLEFKDYLETHGTKTEAWAPFSSGKRNVAENEILIRIGAKYEKTANQIALRYLVQNEIAVIPRSTNKERMKQNLNIFDFELTQDDMEQIQLLNGGHSLYDWMADWE